MPHPRLTSTRRSPTSSLFLTLLACIPPAIAQVQPLTWTSGPDHSWTAVEPSGAEPSPGFTLLPFRETGLRFVNQLTLAEAAANQILLNGSGVAAGDVNGDGWCDLYFARLRGPNALFLNQGGLRFAPVPAAGGAPCEDLYSTGAVLADLDGDGDLDLLVTAIAGGCRAFRNSGRGTFAPWPEAGLLQEYGGSSMTLADVDRDGDLDLYVANYRSETIRSTGLEYRIVDGRPVLREEDRDDLVLTPQGFVQERGEPDLFYRNTGERFVPVDWTDGTFCDADGNPLTEPPRDWGLSAAFHDFNGDGWPDLYVCNDFWTPDRIWINRGDGTFAPAEPSMIRKTSFFSMGIDFADIDRDGHADFFVPDMMSRTHEGRMTQSTGTPLDWQVAGRIDDRPQFDGNTLFRNRGDGTWAEIAQFAGLFATDWSWCPAFLDVDLDGYEDLIITTGFWFDTQDLDSNARIRRMPRNRPRAEYLRQHPMRPVPTMAFRNRGNLRFEDRSTAWGFEDPDIAHGLALADLDNDGDLDVVMNRLNAPAALYRNNATQPRIAVELRQPGPNPTAVGARIRLVTAGLHQSQVVRAGGRYLSGDAPRRTFAVPGQTTSDPLRIEVTWPDGRITAVADVRPDRIYRIEPGTRSVPPPPSPPPPAPLFTDVSGRLAHRHVENDGNDFEAEPLLWRRVSRLGPALAWADCDGDGVPDLVIGGARGGRLALRLNRDGGRRFVPGDGPVAADDQTALAPWHSGGQPALLIGNPRTERPVSPAAGLTTWNTGTTIARPVDAVPGGVRAVATADVDGDGRLDVFVGGFALPGRYPSASPSVLLHDNGDRLVPLARAGDAFADLGLVVSAAFADFDNDGDPDLAVASEWGPVRLLLNDGNSWRTEPSLEAASGSGLWTSLAVGDLNGDGRLDLVAGNLGWNSPYQLHTSGGSGLRLYAFWNPAEGRHRFLEAYETETGVWRPVRSLVELGPHWPELARAFPSHARFAQADVGDLLGDIDTAPLEAACLAVTTFLNTPSGFEARPLPDAAQWAPAQDVRIADFDGDGHLDVFLSQNEFTLRPELARSDAGSGLLLLGDGSGGLAPVPAAVSGIRIPGDQRGAAVADFNKDGRPDLAVTQNGNVTRLLENTRARPGLPCRVDGPTGNPLGIGTRLRLVYPDGLSGPAVEIPGGSGRGSADSTQVVLGLRNDLSPTALRVRVPHASPVDLPIPEGARALRIDTRNGTPRLVPDV